MSYVIIMCIGLVSKNNLTDTLKYDSFDEAVSKTHNRVRFKSKSYGEEWQGLSNKYSKYVIQKELKEERFILVDNLDKDFKKRIEEYIGSIENYIAISSAYEEYILNNFAD